MDDAAIRNALKSRLTIQHSGEDALILDELGLSEGDVRADVAVINGSLNGYEIKSDLDNLHRLPNQRDVYCQFFDTVTLVVARRHLRKARTQVPRWWGIVVAVPSDGRIGLRTLREPKPNPNVEIGAVVKLLWRSEALAILARLGKARGARGKSRDKLWAAIVGQCDKEEVKRLVREQLKARGDWRSAGRRRSSDGLSRLVSTSLHSPVRQRHLHSHQCMHRPN